jgi:hypothetical protein
LIGIFKWDEDVVEKVNKLTLYSCNELNEKQLVMVGYLLELGYDLMINADYNISESPGFEACQNFWRRKMRLRKKMVKQ